MITLEGVAKRFGPKYVLRPTSLTVDSRASLALVGPSGAGKSTILRLIVGLIAPDEGRIAVDGTTLTPATMTAVRRGIGYVIQEGGLFPHLSARDNVTLLAREIGWSVPQIAQRVAQLAKLVRVETGLLDRYPSELSGGERQRVGVMRALMLDPKVLLLDEPMGALDPVGRTRLRRDLKPIFTELGKTVVLVTHDLQEAAYLGDEVALMRDGAIVQRGTMRALVESPADERVREFVEAHGTPCA